MCHYCTRKSHHLDCNATEQDNDLFVYVEVLLQRGKKLLLHLLNVPSYMYLVCCGSVSEVQCYTYHGQGYYLSVDNVLLRVICCSLTDDGRPQK